MNARAQWRNYQDPQLSTVVQRICEQLSALPEKERADGETLHYSVDTGAFDEQALYATARRLCDEGDFYSALPIAMHLTTVSQGRSEYAFVAGSCLQRLGSIEGALTLFTLSAHNGGTAAAWFRMGECLKALGKTAEAFDVLQVCIESAREDTACAELQQAAQIMADGLR